MHVKVPLLLWLALLYPAWLALQAVHELGHVFHARISGATGIEVDLPLWGFSRTSIIGNHHPLFVVWGGIIWGSVLPLLVWVIAPRRWAHLRVILKAFAGLCLIGNGLYLAIGWVDRVGDAGDLMRLGAPPAVLIAVGGLAAATGLWIWHDIGRAKS